MHTTKIGNLIINHDNFDGEIIIHQNGNEVRTQMKFLIEFVGQAIQMAQIGALEELSGEEMIRLISLKGLI